MVRISKGSSVPHSRDVQHNLFLRQSSGLGAKWVTNLVWWRESTQEHPKSSKVLLRKSSSESIFMEPVITTENSSSTMDSLVHWLEWQSTVMAFCTSIDTAKRTIMYMQLQQPFKLVVLLSMLWVITHSVSTAASVGNQPFVCRIITKHQIIPFLFCPSCEDKGKLACSRWSHKAK